MSTNKDQDNDLPEDIDKIEIEEMTEVESSLSDILAEIDEVTSDGSEPTDSFDSELENALVPTDDFADESYGNKQEPRPNRNDVRQWASLAHLSSLLGLATGIGFILGPVLVWLFKKDEDPFIEENAKESINFQLNVLVLEMIFGFVAFILAASLIGIPLLCLLIPVALVLVGAQIILPIIAGMRVNDGGTYRYPFIYRFFK